jgi:integrase
MIKLPPSFMQWLKEHRKVQLEQRFAAGEYWQDHNLVFPGPLGEPLERHQYTALWRRVLTLAGVSAELQAMRPYDARHTMATLMLKQNVPTKVVSARLGHSRASFTPGHLSTRP